MSSSRNKLIVADAASISQLSTDNFRVNVPVPLAANTYVEADGAVTIRSKAGTIQLSGLAGLVADTPEQCVATLAGDAKVDADSYIVLLQPECPEANANVNVTLTAVAANAFAFEVTNIAGGTTADTYVHYLMVPLKYPQ